MTRLNGKRALVIGGARGIGEAIVRRFAAEGAEVAFTGRDADRLRALEATTGSFGISSDASDTADVARAVREASQKLGGIDILVVNAGTAAPARLESETVENMDTIFGLNVRGAVFAAQAGAALLSDGGAIVLVGSIAGSTAVPGYGAYAASKAALRSFARSWAKELAPRKIRVNVVSPGPTDTEMMARMPEERRTQTIAPIPLGRMAEVGEIASAALYLASDEAGYITGAELVVDGGLTA